MGGVQFYNYRVRATREEDLALAVEWMKHWSKGKPEEKWQDSGDARFWLLQGHGRESFLVFEEHVALGFFQIEHIRQASGVGEVPPMTDQVRLHFKASPTASRKKLLRGITKLVPLIEKALALRGVRLIFFTTHSLAMGNFMQKLGYSWQIAVDGGEDGRVMAKQVSRQPPAASRQPDPTGSRQLEAGS